jgi:hypothetical protein
MYYFLATIEIGIQVYFLVHAYQRGRTTWMYFILFVPIVGSAAYFFSEWLPDFDRGVRRGGSGQTLDEVATDISRLANPTGQLEKLKEQLEFSDTFENRLALARECVRSGLFDEAIDMYTSALSGVFSEDPTAMKELAQTYFLKEDNTEALKHVEALREAHPQFKQTEVGIFHARTFEHLGRDDEAMEVYEELLKLSAGYEPRCRYALLLKKNGRVEEATRHFQHILSRAAQAERGYRRRQKQWIDIARQNLDA